MAEFDKAFYSFLISSMLFLVGGLFFAAATTARNPPSLLLSLLDVAFAVVFLVNGARKIYQAGRESVTDKSSNE